MTLKVLQVGAGGWGAKWCHEFLPRARNKGLVSVAGLVDVDPQSLKTSAAALGISDRMCFTDLEEAFRVTKADFCAIVVPPAHHEKVANLAVTAGMHILSEKPIADSMEAAARVTKRVTEAGLKMAVTMSHRYDRDKQTIAAIVRSGHLGRLNTLHCRLSADYRIRDSWRPFRHQMVHPMLLEGAVHHLDILDSMAGARCRTVYATTWRPDWADFDGHTDGTVVMTFENDVHATFEGSKSSAVAVSDWGHEQIRADGSDAIAILDHRELQVFTRISNVESPKDSGFSLGHRARYGHGQHFSLLAGERWGHDLLIERFVDWIEGGPPVETHAESNLLSLATVFAAIESADNHKIVEMKEFLRRYGVG